MLPRNMQKGRRLMLAAVADADDIFTTLHANNRRNAAAEARLIKTGTKQVSSIVIHANVLTEEENVRFSRLTNKDIQTVTS